MEKEVKLNFIKHRGQDWIGIYFDQNLEIGVQFHRGPQVGHDIDLLFQRLARARGTMREVPVTLDFERVPVDLAVAELQLLAHIIVEDADVGRADCR